MGLSSWAYYLQLRHVSDTTFYATFFAAECWPIDSMPIPLVQAADI